MSMYEDMFLEEDATLENETVDESYIDPSDEMSILEAMADIEIEEKACAAKKEACKKEACKKEGTNCKNGVCEKCGKPKNECTCGQ